MQLELTISKDMKTPYFLVHEDKICELLGGLKRALERNWPNYIIGYSFKTNALPWLINYMKNQGCYAETVSMDEYQMAKALKFDEEIIYNGPIKSKETLLDAVANGCIVNIDSKRELRWLMEANVQGKIGVRVNFDLEGYCPGETQCAQEGGRFGFCYENGELASVISKIKASSLSLAGLHLHCSSKTRSLGIYSAIANVCCQIQKEYSLELEYVDIGGGFFGGMPGKPSFEDYINEVAGILSTTFKSKHTKLIVEPGMCLVGSSIDYVTTVVDVKDTTYNRFVITDGSRTNIDPFMKKERYMYNIRYQGDERKVLDKQVICGYTCMENDRLFVLKNENELLEGDQVVYEKVGAYTMCLSPLFIEYFPDVYVVKDNGIEKIRKRWTVEKVLD